MMKYNYTILNIDEKAKVMEVLYSSEGRKDVRVSARLPYEGESLTQIIKIFAPVQYWLTQDKAVVVPTTEQLVGEVSVELQDDRTNKDVDKVLQEIYKDAPKASLSSIQTIKNLNLSSVQLKEWVNGEANIVAIELIGPLGDNNPHAGYVSMLSIKKIVETATSLGLPTFAVSYNQNMIEHGISNLKASSYDLGSGQVLIYIPWDSTMESAKAAATIQEIRDKRNKLLLESDWVFNDDVINLIDIDAWTAYRQTLRDVPEQPGFPDTVVWPTKPV